MGRVSDLKSDNLKLKFGVYAGANILEVCQPSKQVQITDVYVLDNFPSLRTLIQAGAFRCKNV